MNVKNTILSIQRFVLVELEAIIFILVTHQCFKWLRLSEINSPEVIWLQSLFILTAYPLCYFTSKKGNIIWLATISIVSIISGYLLGADVPWLPMVLAVWRSISIADVSVDIMEVYKRMGFLIVFLTIYFIFSHLFQAPIWWEIPLLALGGFGLAIIGMACHNLLEQLSWQPNRQEWKQIYRNQLLFVFAMIMIVIILMMVRKQIIYLATLLVTLFLKLVTIVLAPIIILMSKVISYFYSMMEEGNNGKKGSGMNLSDALANMKVNDAANDLHWIWISLLIVVSICIVVIFVKMIKISFNKEKFNEGDWIEVIEQEADRKNNSIFSFLNNVNPFRRRQKLDTIRLLYIDFLTKYFKLTKDHHSNSITTRDIIKKASNSLSVDEEELQQLTKIYEDHRYGGKPSDASSIQKMRKALDNWLKA